MSDEFFRQIHKMALRIPIPDETRISKKSKEIFTAGEAKLSEYRGHPDTLVEALKIFAGTRTAPYVCAGIAEVLATASFQSGDQFFKEGVEEAMRWLQRAQKLAPNRVEIELIEVGILLNGKNNFEARRVLDRIAARGEADEHDFCTSEMYYSDNVSDVPRAELWFKKAIKSAKTDKQRVRTTEQMAGIHMKHSHYEKALSEFGEVVKHHPDNPWAWHNMCFINYRLGNYNRAAKLNKKTLSLMQFGVAHQLTQMIAKKQAERSFFPHVWEVNIPNTFLNPIQRTTS